MLDHASELALGLALLLPASAGATTVLLGTKATNVSGENARPFQTSATVQYQQVYNSDFFTDGPVYIDTITFFNSVQLGDVYATGDYAISLSTSVNPVNNLDTDNLAVNVGADSAAFASIHLSGSGTSDLELVIDGTDFLYDPSQGDLLIDILITNKLASGAGGFDAMNGTFGSDSSRAYSPFPFGTTSYGLVTEFLTIPVPEPGALTLSMLGLAGLAVLGRRR